jgi:predicted DNA-binding transcriptional regulator YafY
MKILYVMQYFLHYSDENHPRSIAEIIAALDGHGIAAERKSIYDDIECLREYGLDVIQTGTGRNTGYYVASRNFELPELKLLVDSVQSSKFITHKKTFELIKKIESLTSVYDAQALRRQVYVTNRIKTMNESIYYNVDEIHRGIAENKKIRFQYCAWNVKKQLVPKKNGDLYEVSPWCLTWDDENYYLVAYEDATDSIRHYRVDKMLAMHQVDMVRTGRKNFEDFDLATFSKKTFGMFSGTDEKISLRCSNELVGVIIDRFGKDVMIMPVDDQHFLTHVNVTVSPQFFGWLAALGVMAEIISPAHVRESYQAHINKIVEKYNQTLDHGGPK